LYQEKYHDFNVRHFHEKLVEEENVEVSYTWVKLALQAAGLVEKGKRRGQRRRRPRRPMPGMMLHIDGSEHAWFQDERRADLITLMDDANNEVYYGQIVEQESTRTTMAGLREVIESKGLFCSLYSDRASHFFITARAGQKVDRHRFTQVGRALKELGIKMIPSYSPQARGRVERSFRTWAGCNVIVHEMLDGAIVIRYGPHEVARFAASEVPAPSRPRRSASPRPFGVNRSTS